MWLILLPHTRLRRSENDNVELPMAQDFENGCRTLNILKRGKGTSLAILYTKARPISITEKTGVTREFAYTGRAVMTDPRDLPFDYSHLRDDLAYVEVLLPPNAPEHFRDPTVLAAALDMAEIRKIRTALSKRIRKPQGVMSVIIALPPETEVSLAEAVTIARRIVLSSCGSHPVPIHIAIHKALINRHAHAAIGFDR